MKKTLLYVVYEKFLDDEQYSSLSENFNNQRAQVEVTDYPDFHKYFDRDANMGALPYPNVVCLDLQGFSGGFDDDVIERLSGKPSPTVVINGTPEQMEYARKKQLYCVNDNHDLHSIINHNFDLS